MPHVPLGLKLTELEIVDIDFHALSRSGVSLSEAPGIPVVGASGVPHNVIGLNQPLAPRTRHVEQPLSVPL